MSDVDVFDQDQQAQSRLFQRQLHRVLAPGVYSGFNLIKNGDQVDITSGVALVADAQGRQKTVVRDNAQQLEADPNKQYIVIRWEYTNDEDNQADVLPVSVPISHDVVLGFTEFSGGSFDSVVFDERDHPTYTVEYEDGSTEEVVIRPTNAVT